MTPEIIAAASAQVERYEHELDLANADHIALWLEAHDQFGSTTWLAVQIAEAFDRTVNRKHSYWGAGEPDCPRDIKCSNGELHTLRCKVCGRDSPRPPFCIPAKDTNP